MRHFAIASVLVIAATAGAALHHAQISAQTPGKLDSSLISGGTYAVDPGHTQVLFAYDHMGFSKNMGIIAQPSGNLTLDPKAPENASVSISFPVTNIRTAVPAMDEQLMNAGFFDAAKFPMATFQSTAVKVDDMEAEITGNLTIKGITREVTLDATFAGAGANPINKKETVGFSAQAIIKRSDFGLGYAVPVVGDTVELKIAAAFEKE